MWKVGEVLSGMTLDDYFTKHIFKPLKMKDTGFYVPKNKIKRFAACYERTPKEYLRLQDTGDVKVVIQAPPYTCLEEEAWFPLPRIITIFVKCY